TLFTFWPPGPEDRAKVSSKSLSRIPSRVILLLIDFSTIVSRALKPAQHSRGHSEERAPSRPIHSEICPPAGHNFGRANFPAHQKFSQHFQNSRPQRWRPDRVRA